MNGLSWCSGNDLGISMQHNHYLASLVTSPLDSMGSYNPIIPKTPAYVFGEQVVKPMLDTGVWTCSRALDLLRQSALYVDAVFTRALNILPGAAAQQCSGKDDGVPIGFVVASFSSEIPPGYLLCDGSWRSKSVYKDLWEILFKNHGSTVSNDGDNFQIPNCIDLFLTGTNKMQEIAKQYGATTGLPKKLFQITKGGAHAHVTDSSGQHDHQSNVAGEHSHKLDGTGEHTHTISDEGSHEHTTHQAGSHKHGIDKDGGHRHDIYGVGDHNHNPDVNLKLLLHYAKDCSGTVVQTDKDCSEPSLFRAGAIKSAGAHSHDMAWNGEHQHSMDNSVDHEHGMSKEGKHKHSLSKEAHTHGMSPSPEHSHKINFGGMHTHNIAASGDHVHEITGGDDETKPRHTKAFFLIKAQLLGMTPNMRIEKLEMLVQEFMNANSKG